MILFITTAVKTSNPTKTACLYILARHWHAFIRRIWGYHSGCCEEFCILGYNACSLLRVNWLSAGTCRLHLQGRKVNLATNQHETSSRQSHGSLLPTGFLLSFSSILKMEAICSTKTLAGFQRTTRHYIPEYINLLIFVRVYVFWLFNDAASNSAALNAGMVSKQWIR
jgi:hypothetical protein